MSFELANVGHISATAEVNTSGAERSLQQFEQRFDRAGRVAEQAGQKIQRTGKQVDGTGREFQQGGRRAESYARDLDHVGGKAERGSGLLARLAGSVRGLNSALSGGASGGASGGFLPGLANISEIIQGIPQVGRLAGALVRPLTDAAEEGVRFNMLIESATLGFEGVTGGAQESARYVKELTDFAQANPIFNTQGTIAAARMMSVFGFETSKTTDYLKSWGGALAAGGQFNNETLQGVARAFGQIRQKGRVQAEEMEQLAERGIPAWELLARAIGKSVAETRKLAELGRLNGPAAVDAITAMLKTDPRFGGQVDKFANTLEGRLAQLQDLREVAQGRATQGLTRNLNQILASGLTGDNQQIVAAMAGNIDALLTPVAGLVTTAAKGVLGGGITSGLVEGIKAGKDAVAAQVGDLVMGGVIGTAKEWLGIHSPSTEFIEIGRLSAEGFAVGFELQMTQTAERVAGAIRQMTDRQRAEILARDPRVQALIDTIGKGEGTFDPRTGQRSYNKIFGGRRVQLGQDHPGIYVPFGRTSSSAAGLGQFLERTWQGVSRELGGLNFSNPHDQELAMIQLMQRRGMIGPLMQGDTAGAIRRGGREWASLPGSPYGQPTQTLSGALSTFNSRLQVYEQGITTAGGAAAGLGVSLGNATTVLDSFTRTLSAGEAAFRDRYRNFGQDTSARDGGSRPEGRTIFDSVPVNAGEINASFEPLLTTATTISDSLLTIPNLARDAAQGVQGIAPAFKQAEGAAGSFYASVVEGGKDAAKNMDEVADRLTDIFGSSLRRSFTDGWRGALAEAGEMFRDWLLELSLNDFRRTLGSLLNRGQQESSQESEQQRAPGISDLFGSLFDSIFHRGNSQANTSAQQRDSTPAAISRQGQEAVKAVEGAGQAQAGAITTEGKATTAGLGQISRTLLGGLGEIAATIAQGNTRGGFWKGLVAAAAVGAINGALGSIGGGGFGGGNSGGGGSDSFFTGNLGNGLAGGGLLRGPGTGTSDAILGVDPQTKRATAWVSNGEFVIKAASVAKLGTQTLDYLNEFGQLPRRAEGGALFAQSNYVPPTSPALVVAGSQSGPTVINNNNNNLHIHATDAQSVLRSQRQIQRQFVRMLTHE